MAAKVDSKIHAARFIRFKFIFHSFATETFATLSAKTGLIYGAANNYRTGVPVQGGRRVTGEDEVAILDRLMAGEASVVQRLVARFAVLEVGKSPATSRAVLL